MITTKKNYDEIYEIISSVDESELNGAIYNRLSWNLMYYLSPFRHNVISWFPISTEDKILEIGSECGAIGSYMAQNAKSVDMVCANADEKRILEKRFEPFSNVAIMQGIDSGNFGMYDLITAIGALPEAYLYIKGEENAGIELLRFCDKHLKPGGKIFIALPNRLGLKYFAGYRDEYTGEYFAGISDDELDINHTCIYAKDQNKNLVFYGKSTLIKLIKNSGFNMIDMYYPYPDHYFTEEIFSDKSLPKAENLNINNRDFFSNTKKLFKESEAWGKICEEGLFDVFSNSYIAVITK